MLVAFWALRLLVPPLVVVEGSGPLDTLLAFLECKLPGVVGELLVLHMPVLHSLDFWIERCH